MNFAQKNAWFGLVAGVICVGLMGLFGYYLLLEPTTEKFQLLGQLVKVLSNIILLFCFLFSITILRKNQNAPGPDIDERDRQISKKAVLVTFVATCILMFFAMTLPMWIYGLDSSIPVVALPLITAGVFSVGWTIYYATILILYGRDKTCEGETK